MRRSHDKHDDRSASRRPKAAWRVVVLVVIALPMGCMTVPVTERPLLPSRHKIQTGPFVLYTDRNLQTDAPAMRQLIALQGQVEQSLQLKIEGDETPIEIFILNDRKTFSHFLTFYYAELPPRRAFFLAQGKRHVIYTHWGDHLDVDLRHEGTHALLHTVSSELPLWLDEGLAEYFEVPGNRLGMNVEHLNRLRVESKGDWVPNLARLESLTDVRQMTPRDYQESWAWVHLLLNTTPERRELLRDYIGRAFPC